MKSTITVNEVMFMANDTPNGEPILAETHNTGTTTVDEIRNSVDGLCCVTLPGEIN